MTILRLKCFPVILMIIVICNELLHVSASQQCLTWDLDERDNEKIRFTCRVSNFVKPITLTDNHRKLFAQCTFYEKQKLCQPTEKSSFVRVNYTANEVLFYVDRASLWEYEGEWSCHIGREVLISKVSISKGIINETNVRLKSIMRKTNIIELTCSSCKTPVSNYAEFHINGRSVDSLFYDGRSGNCMHHSLPCQPDVCGCSASGTEFFILFTMNISLHVSFSCDLIFLDPVTSAKFSKIATIEKNGTAYKQIKTRTKIIKRGKSKSDMRVSSQPVNKGTTEAIDHVNSTDENDMQGKDDKGHHLLQWILIGLLFLFVIGLAVFSLKETCRKVLGNLLHGNSKKQPHEDASKTVVETPLLEYDGNLIPNNTEKPSLEDTSKVLVETPRLENDGESQNMKDRQSTTTNAENTCRDIEFYAGFDKRYKCESCHNQGKQINAYQYCVNCNEQYCRCCSVSHLSMKMTRTHTIIEISRLLCGLHDKREYTHICHQHGILLCNQCLESCHQNCNVNSINSFKSSYASIKSDDKELMRKSASLTSSMENMNESFYAVTLDTADRQHTTYQGTDYFQKCTRAASTLRKAAIQQPKPRISFTTKDREQSFYQRKTGECYVLRTV